MTGYCEDIKLLQSFAKGVEKFIMDSQVALSRTRTIVAALGAAAAPLLCL